MIASRRAVRARYEFRFGSPELAALAAGVTVVCAMTFVVGLLVGRAMAPAVARSAGVAPAPVEEAGATPPPRSDDHLTFYRTLTAPSTSVPSVGPPAVEEHLVPKGAETVAPAPRVAAVAAVPAAKPDKRPPPAAARAVHERRPAAPAVSHAEPAGTRSRIGASGGPSAATAAWTVQVSSFRSRALADDLRARLAARGLDAYLVSVATEEGRVRYRVRVGAFTTRGEAERVAAELRAERTLSPFVTPRAR